jgi:predicted transcriptional regulator
MAEKKDNPKEFSTCLEDTPFAEMMRKMESQQGIGSLCAEMIKKVMEKQGDDCKIYCSEMMQSMMKKSRAKKEKLKAAKEERDHVRTE